MGLAIRNGVPVAGARGAAVRPKPDRQTSYLCSANISDAPPRISSDILGGVRTLSQSGSVRGDDGRWSPSVSSWP